MPITYTCDSGAALLRTRCTGNVTFGEVLAHFRELGANPVIAGRLDVLLDLTGMDSLPESDQLRAVAKAMEQLRARRVEWGLWAIVAGRDAVYGMSRVFEVFAGDAVANSHVFRSLDEAERWLAAGRQTP